MYKPYLQILSNSDESKLPKYTNVPNSSFKTLFKKFLFPTRSIIKDKVWGGRNYRMVTLKGALKIIY